MTTDLTYDEIEPSFDKWGNEIGEPLFGPPDKPADIEPDDDLEDDNDDDFDDDNYDDFDDLDKDDDDI